MLSIVILGGGSAGWMTAAGLARANLCDTLSLTLVESPQVATVGVGEATLPSIREFNQSLGIDEGEFVTATQATPKLGIEFSGWGGDRPRYLHPFSSFGEDLDAIPFHKIWLLAKSHGYSKPFDAFSFLSHCCEKQRFVPPRPGLPPFDYAYHIDASLYAGVLESYALERGVDQVKGHVDHVLLNRDNGSIDALVLEDGHRIEADLFIDCSGFRSLLLGEALGVPFESWQRWLPCDRAIAVRSRIRSAGQFYTRSIAGPAGWRWQIPLQNRCGNGVVYSSQYLSDDQALAELSGGEFGVKPDDWLSEPKTIGFGAGVRKRQWSRNCVAIGLSAGFLEPLESTSLSLIQIGIYTLLRCLPATPGAACEAAYFNDCMHKEYEAARDFVISHYATNGARQNAFWTECRSVEPPESLKEVFELFKATGVVHNRGFGFQPLSWLAVMIGQGFYPRAGDLRLRSMNYSSVKSWLDELYRNYSRAVDKIG